MEKKEIKTRYAKVNEDDETGIYADAIVEFPAIDIGFVALTTNKPEIIKFISETPKQKLTGPILIPNIKILRKDKDGDFYNLVFTEEEIVKINRKRHKLKMTNDLNLEHNDDLKLDGLIHEEFWIIEDPKNDKANALGFDLPKGTLMTSVYIEDLELYNKIKDNYYGFSIEGYFDIVDSIEETKMETITEYPKVLSNNAQKGIDLNEKVGNRCATQTGKIRARQLANGRPLSLETVKRMYSYLSRAKEYFKPGDTEACGTISYYLWGGEEALGWAERTLAKYDNEELKNLKKNKMNKMLKKLANIFKINLEEFVLEDGTIVVVDDETMVATINGEPAPDGIHTLEDKVMAIQVEDGKLIAVVEVEKEEPEVIIEESKEEVKQVTYVLTDGSEIFVREEDNLAFKNDEVAPDGEYELQDGRILVIEDGRMKEILTLATILSKFKLLKSKIDLLTSTNEELGAHIEKLSKTTRAVAKSEVLPNTAKVDVKQSDLMVNKLQILKNLK
jgi:hypothetical protein